jgi:hypothetical protein
MGIFQARNRQPRGNDELLGAVSNFGGNVGLSVLDVEFVELLFTLECHDDNRVVINVICGSDEHEWSGPVCLALEVVASVGVGKRFSHSLFDDGYMSVVVVVLEMGRSELWLTHGPNSSVIRLD